MPLWKRKSGNFLFSPLPKVMDPIAQQALDTLRSEIDRALREIAEDTETRLTALEKKIK